MTEPKTTTLADGVEFPMVGFGTWRVTGRTGYEAIRTALEVGYRHLDTATMYGNEREVGRAIRDSRLAREDVFITTKLPPERASRPQQTLDESLRALDVSYVDLWLIHWPPRGRASPDTWSHFVAAREEGLARSIGVSNYSTTQIDELTKQTGVTPAVNQVPWNPWRHDPDVLAEARERQVLIEGYSPFKRTDLNTPVLVDIARAHGVGPGQVVLRWHLQHGIAVIPKSVTPERIRSNLDVYGFHLTDDQMTQLDSLS